MTKEEKKENYIVLLTESWKDGAYAYGNAVFVLPDNVPSDSKNVRQYMFDNDLSFNFNNCCAPVSAASPEEAVKVALHNGYYYPHFMAGIEGALDFPAEYDPDTPLKAENLKERIREGGKSITGEPLSSNEDAKKLLAPPILLKPRPYVARLGKLFFGN